MIHYDPGTWGIWFIFRIRGSVFPKACLWAFPNAILAVILHNYLHTGLVDEEGEDGRTFQMDGVDKVWSGYTFVLGFLVVFRNNQAYSRFWEGATLVSQVRGEWFNAVSCLIAFCSKAAEKQYDVDHFQNLLVRLASMLYCAALQQVCELDDDTLDIIESDGLDKDSIAFLKDANDRCEIILQWIQRLVVEAEADGVIKIAPPILSRAYQQLGIGIVNLVNVRKIKDVPFPFPYAQMITCMLLVHWMVTPLWASQIVRSPGMAGSLCFFTIAAYWSLIYIALEIDQPFGADRNDLPVQKYQNDFNRSLLQLLDPKAQHPPRFHHNPARVHSTLSQYCQASNAVLGSKFSRRERKESSIRVRLSQMMFSERSDSLDEWGTEDRAASRRESSTDSETYKQDQLTEPGIKDLQGNGRAHMEVHFESRRELANGFAEKQTSSADKDLTAPPKGILQPRGKLEAPSSPNSATFDASRPASSPTRAFPSALLKSCSMDSEPDLAGQTVHRGVDVFILPLDSQDPAKQPDDRRPVDFTDHTGASAQAWHGHTMSSWV